MQFSDSSSRPCAGLDSLIRSDAPAKLIKQTRYLRTPWLIFNSFVCNKLGIHLLQDESGMTSQTKPSTVLPIHHFEQQQDRSEEHTSELQSLMRISYAVFCLKKKKNKNRQIKITNIKK